jgi:hypothetical protein
MDWKDMQDLSERITEADLIQIRADRTNNYSAWKQRMEAVDKLYRGEWNSVFPDESIEELKPVVSNLVQVGLDDLSHLVAETKPSIREYPRDDSDKALEDARVAEAIADTYWEANRGDTMIPQLALDLAGTGCAIIVVDIMHGEYPCYHRVDPRYAYPSQVNGRLIDLFVAQEIKLRDLKAMFPRLAEDPRVQVSPKDYDTIEVWEYYSADICVQAFGFIKNHKIIKEGCHIIKTWEPKCDQIPVAFTKLDTLDGEIRGIFDQVDSSIRTKNRVVQLLLDYSDQLTYAPMVSMGLINEEERPGPNAHYRLDPNTPGANVTRLAPAGSSPQLYALLDLLEREQRVGVSYPASRQGEVQQSIASASFVNSTQGQLTSTVRHLQGKLGQLREDLVKISFEYDEEYCFMFTDKKPLFRTVGKKKTYSVKDIPEKPMTKVIYGAGAGLDRLNADTRVLQHLGAGLISLETAREQIDYVSHDGEEQNRIEKETVQKVMVQKFLEEAPWQLAGKVSEIMDKEGVNLNEAIALVAEENPPTPEQMGQPPAMPPGPDAGMPAPATEQAALQAGGVPGNPDAQIAPPGPGAPEGAPPPDFSGLSPIRR